MSRSEGRCEMKTKRRFALVLAVLAGLTAVLFLASQPSDPLHKGKRLSEWLQEFDMSNSVLEPDRRRKAEQAIREIGTNALPFLVRELRARDSWLKRKTLKLTPKLLLGRMPTAVFAHVRRQRAVAGFRALGPLGTPALPQLSDLLNDKEIASYAARAMVQMGTDAVPPLMSALTNREPAVRIAAADGLYWLKSDAAPAVPALMAALKEEKESVRRGAASALGNIGQRAEAVVPALLDALKDPISSVRDQAVWALGRFRAEAKAAVPALLKAAKEDADNRVRRSAADALMRIDPDAVTASGLMDPETAAAWKLLEMEAEKLEKK